MAEPSDVTTAPPPTLVAGAVGDRCVNCGSVLSSDQRYCVSCGERRGQARFTLPPASPDPAAVTASSATARRRRPRESRSSGATTMIAGVGTLLLAMGVGVLIGRDSSNGSARTVAAAAPQIITVGGGGAASSTTAAASAKGSGGSGRHHGKGSGKPAAASKPSAATAKKASQAASKVIGGNANLPPATVTEGQTGTGAGFNKTTHKFDGSFFGQ